MGVSTPNLYPVRLHAEQRDAFQAITRTGRGSAAKIRHARVLLLGAPARPRLFRPGVQQSIAGRSNASPGRAAGFGPAKLHRIAATAEACWRLRSRRPRPHLGQAGFDDTVLRRHGSTKIKGTFVHCQFPGRFFILRPGRRVQTIRNSSPR